jgi:hypothetical protein
LVLPLVAQPSARAEAVPPLAYESPAAFVVSPEKEFFGDELFFNFVIASPSVLGRLPEASL